MKRSHQICIEETWQKKAISTFKDHFQAVITGVDSTFPMHLWDHLLPQAENTINMLQPTNIVPTISVYARMNGQYDFNKMPLAPMGCAILFQNKPDIRKSWDAHANKRVLHWNIKGALQSYKIWVKKKKHMLCRHSLFKHKYITMPAVSKADNATLSTGITRWNRTKHWGKEHQPTQMISQYPQQQRLLQEKHWHIRGATPSQRTMVKQGWIGIKTQETQNLPATVGGTENTTEPQKIVASTANPPVVMSPTTLHLSSHHNWNHDPAQIHYSRERYQLHNIQLMGR